MKNTIYLKKLTAKSDTKKEATIEFINGLNVIEGRSDTGKSCILECIDFCFGAKKLPFDKSIVDYDTVELTIGTFNGDITLIRKLSDKSNIFISIQNDENSSKKYKIKNTDKTSFNDILFSSIGIDERHSIIKNQFYEQISLTWRLILQLFIVDSKRIIEDAPILLPKVVTSKTPFLSALIFLLTGNDQSNKSPALRTEIKNAQKEAVKTFAHSQIELNNKNLLATEKYLDPLAKEETEKILKKKINELEKTETQIQNITKKRDEYLSIIQNLQQSIVKSNLLLQRYKNLNTQYEADLKRLSFIVNGETIMNDYKNIEKCPFCHNDIHETEHETYIEYSKTELNNIVSQINDLKDTIENLENEIRNDTDELNKNMALKKEIDKTLYNTLNPKVKELKEYIGETNKITYWESRYDSLKQFQTEINENITNHFAEIEKRTNKKNEAYKPQDYFDKNFGTDMTSYITEILTLCGYGSGSSIIFNPKKYDIEINGSSKSHIHGQGYTSYLNTVVLLAIRKYLFDIAMYNTGFFIIDSPLGSLDQDKSISDLNEKLYKYMADNQNYGQLIILENTKNLPSLEKIDKPFNRITFTGNKNEGRYGFLNDTFNQEIENEN